MSIPFKPRRAAHVAVVQGASVGVFSCVDLFNNSSGAEILLVRSFNAYAAGTAPIYVQNFPGALPGATRPSYHMLVTSEAQGPGIPEYGTVAGLGQPDYELCLDSTRPQWWQHEYPFAVVLPGERVQFTAGVVNTSISLSIVWQAIFAEELERFEKLTGSDW